MDDHVYRFLTWASGTKTGNPGRKAILMLLAQMADWQSGRCEAKVSTISEATEVGDRTVRTHLAWLAESGIIARRPQYRADHGRRGDEYLLLAPWVESWPDGAPLPNPQVGRSSDSTPSPPVAGQEQPLPNGHASKQENAHAQVPDNFPDELRPHARVVMRVLREAAVQQRGKAVTARAVGLVIAARPRKPVVKAAYDYAAWLSGRPGHARDVVAGYRNWLDRESDLATLEPLPGEGGGVGTPPRSRSTRQQRDADLEAALEAGPVDHFGLGRRDDEDVIDAEAIEDDTSEDGA